MERPSGQSAVLWEFKKHTYNAYRKLGVQNRVQLGYFVQNRVPHAG